MEKSTRPLILASTSIYRRELLARLRIDFEVAAPRVTETPQPRETAAQLARRLALAKAEAVARSHPDAWVLGSDQAAACDGRLLGKPGTRAAAHAQLAYLSGREARFVTAISVICAATGRTFGAADLTVVRMRRLGKNEIERYLDREDAADCAGSFKCEGLGIALFSEIRSRDPTALIGLPLIATARLLRRAGFELP